MTAAAPSPVDVQGLARRIMREMLPHQFKVGDTITIQIPRPFPAAATEDMSRWPDAPADDYLQYIVRREDLL